MKYSDWAEQAKNNLSKLPDNELRSLASGSDLDAAKIAEEILLERTNRQAEQKSQAVKKGDKFIWLHSESDFRFGLECEVIEVRGSVVDYKFVGKDWSMATMPLDWTKSEKQYSPEEISAIRKGQRRRRFAEKF